MCIRDRPIICLILFCADVLADDLVHLAAILHLFEDFIDHLLQFSASFGRSDGVFLACEPVSYTHLGSHQNQLSLAGLSAKRRITAGGELHPAPKTALKFVNSITLSPTPVNPQKHMFPECSARPSALCTRG